MSLTSVLKVSSSLLLLLLTSSCHPPLFVFLEIPFTMFFLLPILNFAPPIHPCSPLYQIVGIVCLWCPHLPLILFPSCHIDQSPSLDPMVLLSSFSMPLHYFYFNLQLRAAVHLWISSRVGSPGDTVDIPVNHS